MFLSVFDFASNIITVLTLALTVQEEKLRQKQSQQPGTR